MPLIPVTFTQRADAVRVVFDEILESAGSFDVQNIPATFAHLEILALLRSDTGGTTADTVTTRVNNDSGNNYRQQYVQVNDATVTGAHSADQSAITSPIAVGSGAAANRFAWNRIVIYNYANTVNQKFFEVVSHCLGGVGTDNFFRSGGARWLSTAAINRFQLPGTFAVGSRLTIYGLASA